MKKILMIIWLFLIAGFVLNGQSDSKIKGQVTFITSEHIYVRFSSTDEIKLGDTLVAKEIPCLIVLKKSSTSCVCSAMFDCSVIKNEEVVFNIPNNVESEVLDSVLVDPSDADIIDEETNDVKEIELEEEIPTYKERIRGRLSASSYSDYASNDGEDRHRLMLRASINATHINNSKFSIESYLNYRQNILPSNPNDNQTRFLRLYSLAASYDVNESTRVVLGRKINRKLSSVGAIDGLQMEKYLGNLYGGIIAGFRPDIREFDFNANLFQYGGYLGIQSDNKSTSTQTTIGFLEQRNRGLDRRYVYMQHRSSLGRKLSFFGSMEMDIYGKVDSIKSGDPRLTSLYLSTRYRINRKLSLSVSYDARKRIIYYETLRSEIERLLDDDESRQGLRLSLNLKPLKYVSCGANVSRRFQRSEANKSNNINMFVTHSKVPGIQGSLSVRYNLNSSNYLESKIISTRYSRQLLKNKLSGQLYFRNANYTYYNSELTTSQQYYGVNLSCKLGRGMSLSLLSELSNRKNDRHIRVNTKLIKRFNQQKKK